jgi:hypothetical protein
MNLSLSDIAPFLLIAIIVFINIALWASLRSRATHYQIDLLREVAKTIRKPWEKEDSAMQELSERVKRLYPDNEDIQKDEDE